MRTIAGILLVLFSFMCAVCWDRVESTPKPPGVRSIIEELKQHAFSPNPSREAVELSKWRCDSVLDPEISVPDLFQAWVAGERDFVRLMWWQKDDRITRFFVLMLFYCEVGKEGEEVSSFPRFEPHRFASPEREQLEREIALVRAHRSALAAELAMIFGRIAGIQKDIPARYTSVADLRLGKPLAGASLALPQ